MSVFPFVILVVSLDAYENLSSEYYQLYDCEWLDDLPLQDGRLVRADELGNVSSANGTTSTTTETPEVLDFGEHNASSPKKDRLWLEDAIKDIAYYLRSHKFNEYDRRYERNASTALRAYYLDFPRPPLRALHWEVQKYCEESFQTCIDYLWKKTKTADLKRSDDTSVIMQEQKWTVQTHTLQVTTVEEECIKARRKDDILANPFQGPIERFQWRTTASYYMCWYTMHGVPDLEHINEECDNFAYCLDPMLGARTRDFRATDNVPFACALYSFCPDPCCQKKHVREPGQCWESAENPCYSENSAGQRQCNVSRKQNLDFTDLLLNQWNTSCRCPRAGFAWNSAYGICVDVDECVTGSHACKKPRGEACLNTVGSYQCVCKWGYTRDASNQPCSENMAIAQIKLSHNTETNLPTNQTREKSIIRRWFKKLFKKNSGQITNSSGTSYCTIIELLILTGLKIQMCYP